MAASSNPTTRLTDPVVLLFETSPYGTLDAIVQHDGKSIYFYLNEAQTDSGAAPKFGTRACWVRNLETGPYVLNEEEMRSGISPMLPRTHCVHPQAQPIPVPENLEIIWLEEGNGAALVENTPDSLVSKTLAVIPPWSGLEGFHGYADQCAMESPLCWPMPDNPRLQERIERAQEFWKQFEPNALDTEIGSTEIESTEIGHQPYSDVPFIQLQKEILECYDRQFLNIAKSEDAANHADKDYFAIDGGKFPPRGMVQYRTAETLILATVGMSLCPQPAVEIFSETPQAQRRIELAVRIDGEEKIQSAIGQIGTRLSGLASYPWQNFTWLGAGHTCDFTEVIPGFTGAILAAEDHLQPATDQIKLPPFRDDPVNLLWLIPKTASEMEKLQS